ncbi:hypothetical protein TruAng_002170 [Truncatella angustata]|nr:hypothetical protein TruAng_002170 [Truncatella angustata]
MTSAATPEYEEYPQYCYHLSPTITKWCPLRASDIKDLRWHSGFEGQDDTFFNLNHPIRWVRVVGVIVAIDSFYGCRVYTVDDSTGSCIECSVSLPSSVQANGEKVRGDVQDHAGADHPADPYADIDVGMVVDVKGNLKLFREQKQIKIQKMQRVRSTNQEVQFWNKIKEFRANVLDTPWVLEKKMLRRLEKENKSDANSREKERKRRKQKEEARRHDTDRRRSQPGQAYGAPSTRKLYRPSKLSSVITAEAGQYDALGL